jgi:hypothetical protein
MTVVSVITTHREKHGIWTVTATPETGQHKGKFKITAVFLKDGETRPSRVLNGEHLTKAEVDGWNPTAMWYTPNELSSRKNARMLRGS